MARKHLLDGLLATPKLPDGNSGQAAARISPPALSQGGAIGSVSRSIEALRVEAGEAKGLRAKLEAGQSVVDIDPVLVDASIIADRLGYDAVQMEALVASVAEHGQQVPVLLRPNPQSAGRYQVAYGHRRVQVARKLDRPVRAIVRPLTDAELVVAQGQENNLRTDLTFIERALFAVRLEDAGFDRATIMAALAIDKTGASKLIAVVRRVPVSIIEAIGSAPKAGRDRWMALSDLLETKDAHIAAKAVITSPGFVERSSDERFLALFSTLTAPRVRSPQASWIENNGQRLAQLVAESNRSLIIFKPAQTAGFAEFVGKQLPDLYREFLKTTRDQST